MPWIETSGSPEHCAACVRDSDACEDPNGTGQKRDDTAWRRGYPERPSCVAESALCSPRQLRLHFLCLSQLRLLYYRILVSSYSIASALFWFHSILSPTWILIASALLLPCCSSLPLRQLLLSSSRGRVDLLSLRHAPSSLRASEVPIR